MWFMVILFGIITVTLLSGKGGFLIAGYNLASKEEKAKYNEKKLSRVMGGCTGVIMIMFVIIAIFKDQFLDNFSWLLLTIIIMDVIVTMILANTICKSKQEFISEIEDEREIAKSRSMKKYTWVFTIMIFCVVGALLVTGNVTVQLKEDMIEINSSDWSDKTISYDEINSVSYTENITVGRRTNGIGSFKMQEGHFKNTQYGNYILYSYIKCKSYIVLETNSGMVVINAKDNHETKTLYEAIKQKVNEH
ncbi:MAG: DUF3784 domain-containing protein [Lachnotalea sp.]